MKRVVELLLKRSKKISSMESCTGGYIANQITNIPRSSEVFEFSGVTYSNDYKIKLGVSKDVINEYSVYSENVASEMAYKISCFTNSNYGVGVTGKLKRIDPNNSYGLDDQVFISVYDRDNDRYYNKSIIVTNESRNDNKKQVCDEVIEMLLKILDN